MFIPSVPIEPMPGIPILKPGKPSPNPNPIPKLVLELPKLVLEPPKLLLLELSKLLLLEVPTGSLIPGKINPSVPAVVEIKSPEIMKRR